MAIILKYKPDMVIRNTEQLPKGTGAPYLEVMESHILGEYVAVQWRRSAMNKLPNGHMVVSFGK